MDLRMTKQLQSESLDIVQQFPDASIVKRGDDCARSLRKSQLAKTN